MKMLKGALKTPTHPPWPVPLYGNVLLHSLKCAPFEHFWSTLRNAPLSEAFLSGLWNVPLFRIFLVLFSKCTLDEPVSQQFHRNMLLQNIQQFYLYTPVNIVLLNNIFRICRSVEYDIRRIIWRAWMSGWHTNMACAAISTEEISRRRPRNTRPRKPACLSHLWYEVSPEVWVPFL